MAWNQFTSQIPIPIPITHARHEPLFCLKVELEVEHFHLSQNIECKLAVLRIHWLFEVEARDSAIPMVGVSALAGVVAVAVDITAARARPRQKRRHYINAARLTFRWLNRRSRESNNMRNMLINTRLTHTHTPLLPHPYLFDVNSYVDVSMHGRLLNETPPNTRWVECLAQNIKPTDRK